MITRKIIFFSAIGGTSLVVILTLAGGAMFPDYSHASQFISELGAREAPHASLINFGGFLPAGLLLCLFVVMAWQSLPRSAGTTFGMIGLFLYAFGYVAAAFFPCEPGCRPQEITLTQLLHNVLGLAGYFLAPLSLAILGFQARKWSDAGHLVILGYASAATSFIGLSLLSPEFAYVGLAQRLIEASVLSWMVVCAVYIFRAPASDVAEHRVRSS